MLHSDENAETNSLSDGFTVHSIEVKNGDSGATTGPRSTQGCHPRTDSRQSALEHSFPQVPRYGTEVAIRLCGGQVGEDESNNGEQQRVRQAGHLDLLRNGSGRNGISEMPGRHAPHRTADHLGQYRAKKRHGQPNGGELLTSLEMSPLLTQHLQDGARITDLSRQLWHRNASITSGIRALVTHR